MSARTVLRYVFRPPGTQTVNVPTGAVVRQVGYDSNNMVAVWIEHDVIGKDDPKNITMVERRFALIETGADLPPGPRSYIGTVAGPGQRQVWHVYEVS